MVTIEFATVSDWPVLEHLPAKRGFAFRVLSGTLDMPTGDILELSRPATAVFALVPPAVALSLLGAGFWLAALVVLTIWLMLPGKTFTYRSAHHITAFGSFVRKESDGNTLMSVPLFKRNRV